MDWEQTIGVWIVLSGPVLVLGEVFLFGVGSPVFSPLTLAVALGVCTMFVSERLWMVCVFLGAPVLFLVEVWFLVTPSGQVDPGTLAVSGGWFLVVASMLVLGWGEGERNRPWKRVEEAPTSVDGGDDGNADDDHDTKIWSGGS